MIVTGFNVWLSKLSNVFGMSLKMIVDTGLVLKMSPCRGKGADGDTSRSTELRTFLENQYPATVVSC